MTFERTDPSFVPAPGALPRVVTEPHQLPDDPLRSVGLIEVTTSDAATAAKLAGAKGRELGCWLVVEHAVFEAAPRATFAAGARAILAHGPPHGPETVRVPAKRVTRFDCVIPARHDRA